MTKPSSVTLFRPRVEALEERCCPASIFVIYNTMYIIGDSGDNAVNVDDFGNGNVDASIDAVFRSASNINNVIIRTGDGFDTVDYNLLGDLTRFRTVTTDTGRQDDTVNLNFGGNTIFRPLIATTRTGDGADTVNMSLSDVSSTSVTATTFLGNGDDTYAATLDGDLTGYARALFAVYGSYGMDDISVDASADVDLLGRYTFLKVFLDGGFNDDTINFTYFGELDGKLAFTALGYYGNDTITGDITADTGSTGYLSAVELGGPGDDFLTLNITDVDGTLHILLAVLNGGSGFDTCVATPNVNVFYCEA